MTDITAEIATTIYAMIQGVNYEGNSTPTSDAWASKDANELATEIAGIVDRESMASYEAGYWAAMRELEAAN